MRGLARTRSRRDFPLLLAVVVAALVLALVGVTPAGAADARLESAQQRRVGG